MLEILAQFYCLLFHFSFLNFFFFQLVSFLFGLHTPVQSGLFQEQLWQSQIQQRAPTSWEVFWTLCGCSALWTFASLGVLRSHEAATGAVIIICSSYHLLTGQLFKLLFFSVKYTPPAQPAGVRSPAVYAQCFLKFLYSKQAAMTAYF